MASEGSTELVFLIKWTVRAVTSALPAIHPTDTCFILQLCSTPHLVQFPHGPERLDLVRGVPALLQALVANRSLALHAVHAEVLQLVLRARRV